MFELLPDAFSKVSLRTALAVTVCLSACTGVCIGWFLVAALRLHESIFEYLNILLQMLLCAALAARYYALTLERIEDKGSSATGRN